MNEDESADIDPRVSSAFDNAMREIYRRAKAEAGYNATVFLNMLATIGPIETARRLIRTNQPSDGFVQLWQRGRLDLTVEAHVLKPRFESLFSDRDREACRTRLALYGVTDANLGRWDRA